MKILASHGDGRAPVDSLNRDIAILNASGAEWRARIRRLAGRVPDIDIFGKGYVLRGEEGWEITTEGREFLAMLEAVTQDNLSPSADEPEEHHTARPVQPGETGDLIVVGHRFKNRVHRPGTPSRRIGAIASGINVRRGDNAN